MRDLVLAQLREQGSAAARAGCRAEAAQYLERALALDSSDADLWVLLGTVLADRDARVACARQALALVPDHRPAQVLLSGELPELERPVDGEATAPGPSDGLYRPRLRPAVPRSSFPAGLSVPRSPPRPRPHPADRPLTLALPPAPTRELTPRQRAHLSVALVLLLVLGANLLLGAVYQHKYADRLIPGLRIAGLDVSGLLPAEAERVLQERVAANLRRPVRFVWGRQSWTFTASEIGLHYLTAEAVQEAFRLGHRPSWTAAWAERIRAALGGLDVPLAVETRTDRLEATLDLISADVDRPAVAPSVSWQDGNWLILPGQDGRHVVLEEAESRLLTALASLVGNASAADTPILVVVPVVTDSAALSDADLSRLRRELDLAARPLTLRCAEHTWELAPTDIAAWLRVGLAPPAVEVDREALRAFLAALEPLVATPVQWPRMEISGGRATVFQVGSDGRRLDGEASLSRLESALERRLRGETVEAVELAVQVVSAGQDALMADLGVLELIGQGHSSFAGSPWARVTNIVVGGRELNGHLVAPGEVFSLNDALDPVTWEKGYVMSEIIAGGQVGWGLGGGLCQVATTLFRAAIYSGLEIVERTPHLWRLDWYEQDSPPGFDATIMMGGPDFKFRNNTGHYILIEVETSAEGAWQIVRLYGTSPGWQVTIGDVVDGGKSVSFHRTVTAADGTVLIDETVYSHYQ